MVAQRFTGPVMLAAAAEETVLIFMTAVVMLIAECSMLLTASGYGN